MFVQTNMAGMMAHAEHWSDAVIGITSVHVGADTEIWVAGPACAPELLDEAGHPTGVEAQTVAGSIIALPPQRNVWWGLTLPPPAKGTDEIPFCVQVGDERCYGRARCPPPRQAAPADPFGTVQAKPKAGRAGRPRKVRSFDDDA